MSIAMSAQPLEFFEISKQYGGVRVLCDVSATIAPGTFVAVAGENGAGKSTLLKIIGGLIDADTGSVARGSAEVQANTVSAHAHGIALVPQELEPLRDLSIYENLYLGHEISAGGWLRRGEMVRRARELLERFNVDLDPRTPVRNLSVGNLQLLEIMKAVASGASFVLLDEPTSSLSEHEVKRLFAVLGQLRQQGMGALFTTHKMDEIRQLSDRVLVLRDGRMTLDRLISQVTDQQIVEAMIGRALGNMFPALVAPRDDVVLKVSAVAARPGSRGIDLSVRAGEIVGLAGLVGAGRTEFIEMIFGLRRRASGEVNVNGIAVRPNSVTAAIKGSIALVPEERKTAGLILGLNIVDNATLPALQAFSTFGFLERSRRRARVREVMERLKLRYSSLRQPVATLSGGNQQKTVIGRWLIRHSNVLLLDEPTRGVDIGARSEIYRIVAELAQAGAAIVMASSDMNEVIGLSHRVLVFRDGAVTGELSREQTHQPDGQERLFGLACAPIDEKPCLTS